MKQKATLFVKVNYDGTTFFTCVNVDSYKEHASLEDAEYWLYSNGFRDFDVKTYVQFSY